MAMTTDQEDQAVMSDADIAVLMRGLPLNLMPRQHITPDVVFEKEHHTPIPVLYVGPEAVAYDAAGNVRVSVNGGLLAQLACLAPRLWARLKAAESAADG
jgi:hypothetical protein